MTDDPIVAEVRRHRKVIAEEHGKNLRRIAEAVRKHERDSAREILNPGPKLEEQAVQLPHRERARLPLRLIESLEPGHDEDVDELWLDEAERGLREYDLGGATARDAEEAIAKIERQLT